MFNVLSPIRCKVKIINLDYTYLLKFDLRRKKYPQKKESNFFLSSFLINFSEIWWWWSMFFLISNIFSKSCLNFKFWYTYYLTKIREFIRLTIRLQKLGIFRFHFTFHVGWSCLRRQIGLAEQTLVHRVHAFHIKLYYFQSLCYKSIQKIWFINIYTKIFWPEQPSRKWILHLRTKTFLRASQNRVCNFSVKTMNYFCQSFSKSKILFSWPVGAKLSLIVSKHTSFWAYVALKQYNERKFPLSQLRH